MLHKDQAPALRTPGELLAAQNLALEMIATGRPLDQILDKIVQIVEGQDPSAACCLFLMEEHAVGLGLIVAPRLSADFVSSIRTLRVEDGGASGNAMARRERVIVEDVVTSPLYDG